MPRVECSLGKPGTLIVKFEYHAGAVAAIKRVSGQQWNPEGKYWVVPDSPEARKIVGEIAAMPRDGAAQVIAVKPKVDGARSSKPRARFRQGKDTPLTLKPPHPLIKKVDDELVLRGMAYTTRKSYSQHLRNYFNWLKDRAPGRAIEPEKAGAEEIRA